MELKGKKLKKDNWRYHWSEFLPVNKIMINSINVKNAPKDACVELWIGSNLIYLARSLNLKKKDGM